MQTFGLISDRPSILKIATQRSSGAVVRTWQTALRETRDLWAANIAIWFPEYGDKTAQPPQKTTRETKYTGNRGVCSFHCYRGMESKKTGSHITPLSPANHGHSVWAIPHGRTCLRSPVMLPISPLEYLIAFALAYLSGALWSICFCKYVAKVRREVACHA